MRKLLTASLFSIALVSLAYVLDGVSFPLHPEVMVVPVLPGLTLAAVVYDSHLMDVNGDLIDPAVRMMIGGSLLLWFALVLLSLHVVARVRSRGNLPHG